MKDNFPHSFFFFSLFTKPFFTLWGFIVVIPKHFVNFHPNFPFAIKPDPRFAFPISPVFSLCALNIFFLANVVFYLFAYRMPSKSSKDDTKQVNVFSYIISLHVSLTVVKTRSGFSC